MLTAMSGGWIDKFDTMSDRLFLASTMMIVGLLIVFIILTIIIICIKAMSASINGFSKNEKKERPAVAPVKKEIVKAKPETVSSDEKDEILAVIAAAIHAFSDVSTSDAPYPGFKVKSIRRI